MRYRDHHSSLGHYSFFSQKDGSIKAISENVIVKLLPHWEGSPPVYDHMILKDSIFGSEADCVTMRDIVAAHIVGSRVSAFDIPSVAT